MDIGQQRTVTKPFKLGGTCLRGRQVTVIYEEIRGSDKWACKIRYYHRPGSCTDFWIYDRELLGPDGPLAEAIF